MGENNNNNTLLVILVVFVLFMIISKQKGSQENHNSIIKKIKGTPGSNIKNLFQRIISYAQTPPNNSEETEYPFIPNIRYFVL